MAPRGAQAYGFSPADAPTILPTTMGDGKAALHYLVEIIQRLMS